MLLAQTLIAKWLGYQDSNLEWLNQNQLCCQLHHTPLATRNRRSRALFGPGRRRGWLAAPTVRADVHTTKDFPRPNSRLDCGRRGAVAAGAQPAQTAVPAQQFQRL